MLVTDITPKQFREIILERFKKWSEDDDQANRVADKVLENLKVFIVDVGDTEDMLCNSLLATLAEVYNAWCELGDNEDGLVIRIILDNLYKDLLPHTEHNHYL